MIKRLPHGAAAFFLVLAACGGGADSDGSGQEADVTSQTAVKCVAGERAFSVSRTGRALEGRFKNFDVMNKKEETYDCVLWNKGTIRYRCWRNAGENLFEQVNVMRNASRTPQTEFNLVNSKNEVGGGDFLFSFACEAGSKLDF